MSLLLLLFSLTITALKVGQGDAILIQTPHHKTILIDAGPTNETLKLLREHKVTALNLVVATHPHADHIGGMTKIIQNMPIQQFLDSGQPYSSTTYERMLRALLEKQVKYTKAQRGMTIDIDGIKLQILNPGILIDKVGKGRSVQNANSIVIRLTYGSFSMLFTGDAEFETEAALMSAKLTLRSTILKVGHHGSKHATSGKFLATVRPYAAVICVAQKNDYGHPAPETLKRLAHIPVYKTAEREVIIQTNGQDWRIE